MKVGIATATYNSGKYLKEFLRSLQSQTFQDVELFVCDDRSTDNTTEILDLFGINYCVLNKNSKNCARPYNIALSYLAQRCDYVMKADSDDLLESTCVEKMYKLITSLDLDWVNSNGIAFGDRVLNVENNPYASVESMKEANQLTSWGMWRSDVWQESGGFDETLGGYEDWEFWIRLLKQGYRFGVVREPVYRYRIHSSQSTNDANKIRNQIIKKIISKHYEK